MNPYMNCRAVSYIRTITLLVVVLFSCCYRGVSQLDVIITDLKNSNEAYKINNTKKEATITQPIIYLNSHQYEFKHTFNDHKKIVIQGGNGSFLITPSKSDNIGKDEPVTLTITTKDCKQAASQITLLVKEQKDDKEVGRFIFDLSLKDAITLKNPLDRSKVNETIELTSKVDTLILDTLEFEYCTPPTFNSLIVDTVFTFKLMQKKEEQNSNKFELILAWDTAKRGDIPASILLSKELKFKATFQNASDKTLSEINIPVEIKLKIGQKIVAWLPWLLMVIAILFAAAVGFFVGRRTFLRKWFPHKTKEPYTIDELIKYLADEGVNEELKAKFNNNSEIQKLKKKIEEFDEVVGSVVFNGISKGDSDTLLQKINNLITFERKNERDKVFNAFKKDAAYEKDTQTNDEDKDIKEILEFYFRRKTLYEILGMPSQEERGFDELKGDKKAYDSEIEEFQGKFDDWKKKVNAYDNLIKIVGKPENNTTLNQKLEEYATNKLEALLNEINQQDRTNDSNNKKDLGFEEKIKQKIENYPVSKRFLNAINYQVQGGFSYENFVTEIERKIREFNEINTRLPKKEDKNTETLVQRMENYKLQYINETLLRTFSKVDEKNGKQSNNTNKSVPIEDYFAIETKVKNYFPVDIFNENWDKLKSNSGSSTSLELLEYAIKKAAEDKIPLPPPDQNPIKKNMEKFLKKYEESSPNNSTLDFEMSKMLVEKCQELLKLFDIDKNAYEKQDFKNSEKVVETSGNALKNVVIKWLDNGNSEVEIKAKLEKIKALSEVNVELDGKGELIEYANNALTSHSKGFKDYFDNGDKKNLESTLETTIKSLVTSTLNYAGTILNDPQVLLIFSTDFHTKVSNFEKAKKKEGYKQVWDCYKEDGNSLLDKLEWDKDKKEEITAEKEQKKQSKQTIENFKTDITEIETSLAKDVENFEKPKRITELVGLNDKIYNVIHDITLQKETLNQSITAFQSEAQIIEAWLKEVDNQSLTNYTELQEGNRLKGVSQTLNDKIKEYFDFVKSLIKPAEDDQITLEETLTFSEASEKIKNAIDSWRSKANINPISDPSSYSQLFLKGKEEDSKVKSVIKFDELINAFINLRKAVEKVMENKKYGTPYEALYRRLNEEKNSEKGIWGGIRLLEDEEGLKTEFEVKSKHEIPLDSFYESFLENFLIVELDTLTRLYAYAKSNKEALQAGFIKSVSDTFVESFDNFSERLKSLLKVELIIPIPFKDKIDSDKHTNEVAFVLKGLSDEFNRLWDNMNKFEIYDIRRIGLKPKDGHLIKAQVMSK